MDSPDENIFEQELEALQNFIVENENVGAIINEPDTIQEENNVQPIANSSNAGASNSSDSVAELNADTIRVENSPLLNNNAESRDINNLPNVIEISDSPPVQRLLRSRLIYTSPAVEIQLLEDVAAPAQIAEVVPPVSGSVSPLRNLENINQNDESPVAKKKRKRSSPKTKTEDNGPMSTLADDDDDGATCPICLEQWEMSGTHRLVSLKCGHLFGHSCIQRWITECQGQQKCCPSCKSRAVIRDFRFLYAKKLCAVDKTEEYRLRNELQIEKAKVIKLKNDYCNVKVDFDLLQKKNTELQLRINEYKAKEFSCSADLETSTSNPSISYKLNLDKNILLSKDVGGCRVMIFGKNTKQLFLSQKSTTEMFAGYGIRSIDTNSFKPLNFVYISSKTLRDFSLNSTQDVIAISAMDPFVSIYNVNNRVILRSNAPNTLPIWSSCFDATNDNLLYLGQQNGKTHIYDLRNSGQYVNTIDGKDSSPVINLFSIKPSALFAYGGLIVCTLQNLWLYELSETKSVKIWRLNITGPFISMQYNDETLSILITTRPNSSFPQVRFIVGCIDSMIHDFDSTKLFYFRTFATFEGSKIQTIMTRSTLININNSTIVAGYMQDYKHLSTWSVNDKSKIQNIPINETILDLCSINFGNGKHYCGALSDNRLRLYKVNST